MEDRDDPSSSPVPSLHLHQRHRSPSPSGDVISRGHLQVTCSGEGEEVRASEREEPLTCKLRPRTDDVLPIKCHCDVREAGEDQWAGLSRTDDVTEAVRTNQNSSSCTKESKVNSCHRPVTAGSCGGGASGGADLHLDELADPTRTVMTSNFDPETQEEEGVTSDLQELSSDDDDDDDEAFTTDPPLPPGELCPAPTVTASAIPARSKNTFQSGRRQSAPDQLVQEDGGSESELQSRRPGIVEFFSSRKQRSVSHSVPGWKLFGKVPPKQSPTKEARIIQQEFEARQVVACSSPTHHAAGQQSWRKVEVEPLSTTALILEDRPQNLPAKSAEETQRHREEYEVMVAEAKRKELKEAQRKEERKKERLRQEEQISNNTSIWTNQILPHWDHMKSSRRVRDLWWEGLPPSVRGRVWSVAIGNELNITAELYEIFLCRAREKGRSLAVTQSDEGASPADREASLELITRDVSRTFPSLCVFQKGGPYHDMLQSILGAYTCYRPDVGYVQGMSSMAAMLVLNMEEVDAFISFSNLINRPCQLTFCRVDHQQMLRYFGTFQVFFEDALPRLFLHFRSSGVTPDLYLMDWILSLYTKPLPLDVACRVWDVFFRDGEEFLFRAALGILRMYQDVLLDLDLISIAQFLSRLPDEEQLSDRLFSYISATPILSRNRKWSQVLSSYSS